MTNKLTNSTDSRDRATQTVFAYHERTKHHLKRFAASLGYLDWDRQPIPFRRFEGAPQLPLAEIPPTASPTYDDLFSGQLPSPQPITRQTISQFFYDSLALSAWKAVPGSRWSLRVNPSSGNLHPTEGYLISGPIDGLFDDACVCHYAPFEHALEVRRRAARDTWPFPNDCFFVALTSIHWRESWKYGERAYRYCQHDAGHAIAAIAIAARVLGWRCHVLESWSDDDIARLTGTDQQSGIEAEHPDCLIAVSAALGAIPHVRPENFDTISHVPLAGIPNRLSHDHHEWPVIEDVAAAANKPRIAEIAPMETSVTNYTGGLARSVSARQIIRQRRSAVAMDGHTEIGREEFLRILRRVMPQQSIVPFDSWPWKPSVHLALFVHRVRDMKRGLYLLARDATRVDWLKLELSNTFSWTPIVDDVDVLPLFLLREGDFGRTSNLVSCHQEIAQDGAFAAAMLAEFEAPIRDCGPWFYRRIFWETGMIGQVLYLEAEAAGVRSTGIGCFFDDAMHEVLGISNRSLQSLYHFTVGGPLEDARLQTLPAYSHLSRKGP
jgi:SagB-type dehydrogenase family enzyme